ncbi:MAG: hypothetical protein ACYCRD_06320 [Leptospirillum sp.]
MGRIDILIRDPRFFGRRRKPAGLSRLLRPEAVVGLVRRMRRFFDCDKMPQK